MSYVHNYILTAGCGEPIKGLLSVCGAVGANLPAWWQSDKSLHNGKSSECEVAIFALNYVSSEKFLQAVIDAPWKNPEVVQVFMLDQDGELFKEVLCGGKQRLTLDGRRGL